MANRAYLFCSDCDPNEPKTWVNLDVNAGHNYYDSRHGIPLAWFFFFHTNAVKMVPVTGYGSTWQEVKFMADKHQAIRYFSEKQSLVSLIVGPLLPSDALEQFLMRIESWPGNCLLVDPSEVVEDGDADAVWFRRITKLIGEDKPDMKALREDLGHYSFVNFKNEYQAILNVLGCTYG